MIAKEQAAIRRNELLQVVTGSEAVLSIIGLDGLATMLREIFHAADFKEEVVPEKREMIRRQQKEQMLMSPGVPGGPGQSLFTLFERV